MSLAKLFEPVKVDMFGSLDLGDREGTEGAVKDLRAWFAFDVPANLFHETCVHGGLVQVRMRGKAREEIAHSLLFAGLFWARFDSIADQNQFVFGKDKEIEDIEDAGCVNEEKSEEPVAVIVAGRFPESQTRPNQ